MVERDFVAASMESVQRGPSESDLLALAKRERAKAKKARKEARRYVLRRDRGWEQGREREGGGERERWVC